MGIKGIRIAGSCHPFLDRPPYAPFPCSLGYCSLYFGVFFFHCLRCVCCSESACPYFCSLHRCQLLLLCVVLLLWSTEDTSTVLHQHPSHRLLFRRHLCLHPACPLTTKGGQPSCWCGLGLYLPETDGSILPSVSPWTTSSGTWILL